MTHDEIEARLKEIQCDIITNREGWEYDDASTPIEKSELNWLIETLRASLKREAMMKKALEKYSTYPSDILYFDIDSIGNVINPHELVKNVQMPINIVARECLAELEKD